MSLHIKHGARYGVHVDSQRFLSCGQDNRSPSHTSGRMENDGIFPLSNLAGERIDNLDRGLLGDVLCIQSFNPIGLVIEIDYKGLAHHVHARQGSGMADHGRHFPPGGIELDGGEEIRKENGRQTHYEGNKKEDDNNLEKCKAFMRPFHLSRSFHFLCPAPAAI